MAVVTEWCTAKGFRAFTAAAETYLMKHWNQLGLPRMQGLEKFSYFEDDVGRQALVFGTGCLESQARLTALFEARLEQAGLAGRKHESKDCATEAGRVKLNDTLRATRCTVRIS
jgi:hypothetical protein